MKQNKKEINAAYLVSRPSYDQIIATYKFNAGNLLRMTTKSR